MPNAFLCNSLGCGWGVVSAFFMFIFWVLIIILIVAILRAAARGGRYGNRYERRNTSMDILKERYAKGEITKEEYEKMKKDLGE